MTLLEIENDVQSNLGFTVNSTSRVTATEVEQWINQAYRICQSKLANANVNYYKGEMMETDTDPSDAGGAEGRYDLPVNFMAMKRLEIQYNDDEDKKRAIGIDINDIQQTLDPDDDPWSQERPYYAIWEDFFYIKPIPNKNS